jgi:release factor glutamine methyltransferase
LICANLPYIPTATLATLRVVQWEPRLALDGGGDGLAWIGCLLEMAQQSLAAHGLLLLEIEASQGAAARRLAQRAFPCADVDIMFDLAGHDRLVCVRNP